ncbi:MAG: hypothetical protein VKN60_02110 [Cyanobacteriota bacterium]|nr:hypothetical protein [Cyanobacteriota bacterium]
MTPEKPATPAPEVETEAQKTAARGRRPSAKPETSEESSALSLAAPQPVGGLKLMAGDGGLPNNRPIEASHLKVVSTYTTVGGVRPVGASGMELSGTLTISGNRPIALSHLKISETYSVMGNRPVASNEIDDPAALMGFLD